MAFRSESAAKLIELHSGHTCELEGHQTLLIDVFCPECHKILSNPYHTNCNCGHSFCAKDLRVHQPQERLHWSGKSAVAIVELQVHCHYKSDGCEWVGSVEKFLEHVNEDPSSQDILRGCGFVMLPCKHCKGKYARSKVVHHQTVCESRPYTCEYCNKPGTYKAVRIHWARCKKYPVECTNKCGISIPREYLPHHLIGQCSMRLVDCPYRVCGCEIKVTHKDVKDHLLEKIQTHSELLLRQLDVQGKKHAEEKVEMELQLKAQAEQHAEDMEDIRTQLKAQVKQHVKDMDKIRLELKVLKKQVSCLESKLLYVMDSFHEVEDMSTKEARLRLYMAMRSDMSILKLKLDSKADKQAVGEIRRQMDKHHRK